jgi:hypothetical protein
MSAVLMCDSCGTIFSVNQEGWKEFTENISSSESNAYNVGKRQQHIGPCCVISNKAQFPTIAKQDAKPLAIAADEG